MSLVPCNACGGQVSKTAKACPHCGEKDPGKWKMKPLYWFILFVVGSVAALIDIAMNGLNV
jgi:hypothetical protein